MDRCFEFDNVSDPALYWKWIVERLISLKKNAIISNLAEYLISTFILVNKCNFLSELFE
jgi:hypothetical protein